MSDNQNPNPAPAVSVDPKDWTAGIPTGGVSSAEISNQEIREILAGLDDIRLRQVQGILKAKGWYGSSDRGNGFSPTDLNVFQNFYQVAKAKGINWEAALTQVSKGPDLVLGSDSVNKVPSPIDLKEILQRTALTVMGRKLDDNTVQNLVSSYQSVSNGTASTQAPAADTFFKSRIEQKYGAESDATKYLSAISNVSKVLGNL
tara:strand:+ start:5512 stop:6120 length:609 start_codon:yes stop_codon:yes gene_type:complete